MSEVIIKHNGIELHVYGSYDKGHPGVHTYSNGDPGYPPEPPSFEIERINFLLPEEDGFPHNTYMNMLPILEAYDCLDLIAEQCIEQMQYP